MVVRYTALPRGAALLMMAFSWHVPTSAQDAQGGGTPVAATGKIGQRQTRAEAAPNIEPLGRLQTRVQNRVQLRLRNRIDRFYDPTGNATLPFEAASDQARITGRPRVR